MPRSDLDSKKSTAYSIWRRFYGSFISSTRPFLLAWVGCLFTSIEISQVIFEESVFFQPNLVQSSYPSQKRQVGRQSEKFGGRNFAAIRRTKNISSRHSHHFLIWGLSPFQFFVKSPGIFSVSMKSVIFPKSSSLKQNIDVNLYVFLCNWEWKCSQ